MWVPFFIMRRFFRFLNTKYVQVPWLVALLACPIILWLLPGDFFDNTGIELCPSKAFFDIECFGCGLTRAVMHFHHFEFDDAVFYNILVFVAYPLLVVQWGYWVYKSYKRVTLKSNTVAN